MATSPTSFFYAMLVFVSLCSSLGNKVYGDDRLQGFGLAKVDDFRHGTICSESKVLGPYSLKVVHRYGPCSPTRDDPPPTVHEILSQDAPRVAHLHDLVRRIRWNSSADHALQGSLQAAATVRVHRLVSSYVATVGVGTPARERTLMLDTGSDLCWLQCEPCNKCYAQDQPIFDPHTSRSYHNVTCDAQACLHLDDDERGCVENTCVYRVDYADHSSTTGFLATERLTLAGSSVLENFVFGCGHRNEGSFSSRAAGILGLGRGYHSFARQAAHLYRLRDDNAFSYCLPGVKDRVGHLTFGRRAAVGSPAAYTPMVYPLGVHDDGGLYFVEFGGISVGKRWVSVGGGTKHGGTVIDSGTIFSWLPPVAYRVLRGVFREGMTKYREAPPHGPLDTCYIITEPSFQYPPIILHFLGVDLFLKPAQVFYHNADHDSVYCLAFASNAEVDEPSIIGNTQQRGMEVIFDNQNHRIGFSRSVQC